jgi:hypothetical protein
MGLAPTVSAAPAHEKGPPRGWMARSLVIPLSLRFNLSPDQVRISETTLYNRRPEARPTVASQTSGL